MIIEKDSRIRLLEARECYWGAKNVQVIARPFAALSIRLKGDSEITEGGKTERMKTGDILYMPAGVTYRLNCSDERIMVVHFEADASAAEHMHLFRLADISRVRSMFSELLSVFAGRREGYYFKALSIFYGIIGELCRDESPARTELFERIRPAVEYMNSSYTDPNLTVEELSKRAFMSDTYFRRLFRELYGRNPLEYLNSLRLSHARVLLLEAASGVGEVAAASGFSDVKYFSTFFKSKLGVTPSEYRRRK